ncbi:MAG: hypothetical protein M1832_005057 [Thelocarpon impressellum]|nr:MAG: hypothetical protein M1832_005057 [Thelocarpon impressellum]
MRNFKAPKHIREHRVAGKALYRALLTLCPRLPIPDDGRASLRRLIRMTFWSNRHLQGTARLKYAFDAGHEAHSILQASASGAEEAATSRILALLATLPPPSPPKTQQTRKPASPQDPTSKASRPRRLPAPYPNATPVLARPHLQISGRRHVPTLVSTNSLPFLRFKKPQSPFLTRIIRNKLEQKEKRYHLLYDLQAQLALAKSEDVWDEVVPLGYEGVRRGQNTWAWHVREAICLVEDRLEEEEERRKRLARRLQWIVELEEVLAQKESVSRRIQGLEQAVRRSEGRKMA